MKKETKRKNRKFLFSLLIGLFVAFSGLTAYATATGQMPQVLSVVASVFAPSAAGNSSKAKIADLQTVSSQSTVSDSSIDPSEINPTDSIAHNDSSSSVSSADPDAKVDDTPISNRGDTNVEPLPISVTPVTTSTPSKPATNTSSKAPTTSKPSAPTSSAPSSSLVSSSPSSSPSGGYYSNPITGVSLDKTTLKLNKGETSEALKATITPSGATGDKTITWKSDNTSIVTIDQTGKVTAVGPGTTQIEAITSNGKVALCTVTVLVPPTGIKINAEDFSIDKGSSKTLTATLEPTDCTDASVKWSTSNSDIATVDSTGKVTGAAPGKATITVSTLDGKYSASCKVTVVISISSLTLDQASLTLFKGSQATLTATIVPPDTTEDKTIQWSSTNPAAATVDSNGLITAVEGGTTTITAQAGSHIAECKVTVIVPVTGIEMTEHSVTMAKGTDKTLSVKITPDDATDKQVAWASSDEKVATVDSSGKVTAVNVGSAVITATTHDGGYSVQCNLSVVIPVTGITLDKQSLTINRGSTSALLASITPADATDQAVLWQSTNPSVASVDQTGKITAVGAGNAIITVTTHDGGFIAQCNVTVIVPINTITLNQTSAVLLVQNTLNLSVSIDPPDTTEDKTVSWSSSDSNIATVDSAGKVTGIKAGNVVIKAQVGTHAANCSITVKLPPVTWTITPDCSSDNVLLSGYNNDAMDTMSTVITTTEFNNPISMNSISVSSSYSVYYGSGSYYYGSYDCPIGGYVAYTDGTKLNMNSLYNPVITLDKTKKVQSIYLTVSYSGIHYHYQASYSAVVTVDSDDYGNFKLGSNKSQEHV